MIWLWAAIGGLALAAGIRYRTRLRALRALRGSARPTPLDDAAIQRIRRDGTLTTDDEEPLDLREAERAEEEFWRDSWDEPEEMGF